MQHPTHLEGLRSCPWLWLACSVSLPHYWVFLEPQFWLANTVTLSLIRRAWGSTHDMVGPHRKPAPHWEGPGYCLQLWSASVATVSPLGGFGVPPCLQSAGMGAMNPTGKAQEFTTHYCQLAWRSHLPITRRPWGPNINRLMQQPHPQPGWSEVPPWD